MVVQLIAHTNDPEKTVAAAAKLCYSDAHIETLLDGLTPDKTAAFLQKLTDLGHASPIEHASFTFGIEGGLPHVPCAGDPAPHRQLQRAEPALCAAGGFPLCHSAGNRGDPRGQGTVHRCHERRRPKVSGAGAVSGRRPHPASYGTGHGGEGSPGPRPPSRPMRTHGLCCPTPARPRWS